jgi:hypothetical protein
MAGSDPERLGSLARLVVALGVLLVLAGIVVHGVTVGTFARIWHDLVERPDGPMAFRFVLQPAMGAIAAIHDGLKDARGGNRPFVETVLRDPAKRAARLREGLNATARILLLGLVMDGAYQALVLHRFYPSEAVIVALLLGLLPYVILRGLITRAARRRPAAQRVQ